LNMLIIVAYLVTLLIAIISPRLSYVSTSVVSLVMIYNSLSMSSISDYFAFILGIIWFCTGIWSAFYSNKKDKAILYSLTLFSITIILWAKDVLTFLAGWELMTISTFLSIDNRSSAYKFLAFGELSTILILLGFAFGIEYGISLNSLLISKYYSLVFLFCTLGFMVKMEIFPFHIWAPPAYRDSPTNFTVLMSSCLTLMGVYGIMYLLSLSTPPTWIAVIMLIFGAITAVYGALHSATSEDVKVLPSYSTIENDGVILLLLATFSIAKSSKVLSAFALTATMFYLLFHSLSKSLMFLAIGNVEKESKLEFGKSAVSIGTFIAGYVASLSLAAIPPFPGFTAEWMALETLFQSFELNTPIKLLIVIAGALVALSAGICAISMSKVAIYLFRRKNECKTKTNKLMIAPLLILSSIVVAFGVYPPAAIKMFSQLVFLISGYSATNFIGGLLSIPKGLLIISGKGFGCISPTVLATFLLAIAISIGVVSKFIVKNLRLDDPWMGGEYSENYTPEGYSMILRLTLKSFYGTEEKRCFVRWCDRLEKIYDTTYFSNLCNEFRVRLMNGNVGYYVLYIMLAMGAVLLYSVLI